MSIKHCHGALLRCWGFYLWPCFRVLLGALSLKVGHPTQSLIFITVHKHSSYLCAVYLNQPNILSAFAKLWHRCLFIVSQYLVLPQIFFTFLPSLCLLGEGKGTSLSLEGLFDWGLLQEQKCTLAITRCFLSYLFSKAFIFQQRKTF